jgi:hypothetical protein
MEKPPRSLKRARQGALEKQKLAEIEKKYEGYRAELPDTFPRLQTAPRHELQAIATLASSDQGIELERDVKRSKKLLLQWFNMHSARISGVVQDSVVVSAGESQEDILKKLDETDTDLVAILNLMK